MSERYYFYIIFYIYICIEIRGEINKRELRGRATSGFRVTFNTDDN